MSRAGSLLSTVALTAATLAATVTPADAADDGHLAGRIIAPDGTPLARARVELYANLGTGFPFVTSGTTDANGRYDVPAAPEDYRVKVVDVCGVNSSIVYQAPSGLIGDGGDVSLLAGRTRTLDLALPFENPTSPSEDPCIRVLPQVSGTPKVGVPLTATAGTWAQRDVAVTYLWQDDTLGKPIEGATSATYTPTADRVGHQLHVDVVGHRLTLAALFQPAAKTVVAPGDIVISQAPFVTGPPAVKGVLRSASGTSTPDAAVTYQWLRNGAPIAGAVRPSYKIVPADKGKLVAVAMTYQAPGHVPLTRVVKAAATVRTLAKESVKAKGGRRSVTFKVAVRPQASPKAKGTITVREDGRKVKGATIRSGSVSFTATHLTKGVHHFSVTYVSKRHAAEKSVRVRVS